MHYPADQNSKVPVIHFKNDNHAIVFTAYQSLYSESMLTQSKYRILREIEFEKVPYSRMHRHSSASSTQLQRQTLSWECLALAALTSRSKTSGCKWHRAATGALYESPKLFRSIAMPLRLHSHRCAQPRYTLRQLVVARCSGHRWP